MPTFLVFLLAYTLSQFYRSFVAVIAPELSAALKLTPADLGLMSAAWFAAFAIAQLPVGWALDRFGPRRTVPVGMLAAVAGALLCARAQGLADGVIAMALIGVGCAPVYMGALYVFGRSFPADRFALLASWLLAIGSVGNLLSATPLALVTVAVGWRAAFLGLAGVTALSALLVAILVRDPPRLIQPAVAGRSAWADYRDLLGIRSLWPMLPLVAVSYAVLIAERGVWVGPYLAEVQTLDAVPRGNAAFIIAAIMIGAVFLYGALDRFVPRSLLIGVGSLSSAAGFFTLWAWPSPPLWAAVGLIALACAFNNTFAVLMTQARSVLPDHLLGRGITGINFLFMTGAAIVQYGSGRLVGALQAAGKPSSEVYASLHFGFGALLLAAALVFVVSRWREP